MTSKSIVEHLNIFKDILSGLSLGGVLPMKDQLGFEGAKETFNGRIVVTITFAAHAIHHLSLCQQKLVIITGVLAAPVRVVQQTGGWLASGQGRL